MQEGADTLDDIHFVDAARNNLWALGIDDRDNHLYRLNAEDVADILIDIDLDPSNTATYNQRYLSVTSHGLFVMQHDTVNLDYLIERRDLDDGSVIWSKTASVPDPLARPVKIVTNDDYAFVMNVGNISTSVSAVLSKVQLDDGTEIDSYARVSAEFQDVTLLDDILYVALYASPQIESVPISTMNRDQLFNVTDNPASIVNDGDFLYVFYQGTGQDIVRKHATTMTVLASRTISQLPFDRIATIGKAANQDPSDIYYGAVVGSSVSYTRMLRSDLTDASGASVTLSGTYEHQSIAIILELAQGWVVGSVGW
jgi:hypothetical protein